MSNSCGVPRIQKTFPLSHRRPVPSSSEHTVKREAKSERRILREGGSAAKRPTSRVANACAKAGRGGEEKRNRGQRGGAHNVRSTLHRAPVATVYGQTTYENAGAMMRRCVLWSSPSAHTRPLPRTFATGGLNAGDFTASGRGKKFARQCLRFTVQSHKPREEILSSRADGLLPEGWFH